ncbi:MAG: CapA family protein [Opitutaceae bacterium]|nr:CapA family protein [Verrucomicrobiales bacterium]
MIRILVGGDVSPMGKVNTAFIAGQASDIFHDLLPEIQAADLAVVNLECPLVSRSSPILKVAPALAASPDSIQGFANAQWDVLNLANNHSFDHGADGLQETIKTVRKAGLDIVGGGANLAEARTPIVRQINGRRIVICSMAEREFSIADEANPGANPLDLITFVQTVREYKQDGIFITLVHGGLEYYPYPTPEMIRRCRFMVEMGADAVICCHTHCPLPWETYAGRPIVYGLGNLIFEPFGLARPSWYQGYLARLEIDENGVRFEPVPYTQSRDSIGATAMGGPEASAFLAELRVRNGELEDVGLLENKWREFCRLQRAEYLSMLFAYSPLMDRFRRLTLPRLHSKKDIGQALLLVQCETHREILETIFRDERGT